MKVQPKQSVSADARIDTRVFHSVDQISEFLPEWLGLWRKNGGIFSAPFWVVPWLRMPGKRFALVAMRNPKDLCAVYAFAASSDGSYLEVNGGCQRSDHVDIVSLGVFTHAARAALPHFGCKSVKLRIKDPAGAALRKNAHLYPDMVVVAEEYGSALHTAGRHYSLPAKLMRKVRYYKRRSLATIGLSISICKPWQVDEEFLFRTIAQRDRSLEAKGKITECPEEAQGISLVRFFRQILEMTHASADFLVICIARSKEGPVGGALYFRAGKELMKYLQGWLSTVEQYNVGTLMDVAMLQWAWAAGYERVDFGRGEEPYKNSLGGKRETYLNVVYRP